MNYLIDDIRTGENFKSNSEKCLLRAVKNSRSVCSNLINPIIAKPYSMAVIAYPLAHTFQLIINIGFLLYGGLSLIGALATLNGEAACKIVMGINNILGSICLEVCNIILSLVSILTRHAATAAHGGYLKPLQDVVKYKQINQRKALYEAADAELGTVLTFVPSF